MITWPAEWFDEIDSTNEEARRRVSSGQFTDGWIAARKQTSGRGRLGRDWVSPRGNLFSTALFRFEGGMLEATKVPFVAALAVADVFNAFVPNHPVQVKWPNDVRYNRAKLSGILIEAGTIDDVCWVAAGIGINVAHAPPGVEQAASCLADLRGDNAVTAEMVFEALRSTFSARLCQLETGFASIRADWLERAEGLTSKASVTYGSAKLEGIFEGMGAGGEMLLRLPNGEVRSITAGDVELIKKRMA